jgi:hypothetical protein
MWSRLIWLRSSGKVSEHGNEPSCSKTCGEFVLKTDSDPLRLYRVKIYSFDVYENIRVCITEPARTVSVMWQRRLVYVTCLPCKVYLMDSVLPHFVDSLSTALPNLHLKVKRLMYNLFLLWLPLSSFCPINFSVLTHFMWIFNYLIEILVSLFA